MRLPLKFFAVVSFCFLSFADQALAAYDKPYVGDQKIYIAKHEDTLVHIARYFELGFVEMRAANPYLDPWIPGEGTKVILPSRHIFPDAPHEGIVINLPEMRLYAFVNGDEAPTTFPLGIGREGLETPTGTTKVVRKKERPEWRPTLRMRKEDPKLPEVVGPGPENPLGTHALYLGWPTYAMHGTNKPYGIGRRISSGCIRLYPENIIKLYDMIPVGTPVRVVDQPIKLAWIDDVLYLEAHPGMDQAIQMEETGQIYTAQMSDEDLHQILKAAGEYKDRLHWAAIRNAIRNRTGMPVMIARRPGGEIDEDFEVLDGDDINLKAMISGESEDESGQSHADNKDEDEQSAASGEGEKQGAQQALDDVYGAESAENDDIAMAEDKDQPDKARDRDEKSEAPEEAKEKSQTPASITRTLNP